MTPYISTIYLPADVSANPEVRLLCVDHASGKRHLAEAKSMIQKVIGSSKVTPFKVFDANRQTFCHMWTSRGAFAESSKAPVNQFAETVRKHVLSSDIPDKTVHGDALITDVIADDQLLNINEFLMYVMQRALRNRIEFPPGWTPDEIVVEERVEEAEDETTGYFTKMVNERLSGDGA